MGQDSLSVCETNTDERESGNNREGFTSGGVRAQREKIYPFPSELHPKPLIL